MPFPHCLTPQEIASRLQEAGIQPTAQRIAVCQYVLCEADHPTADGVKTWVDANFPKMSLATIYNTLNLLVQAGLLAERRFPHQESAVYDANMESHFHFLDEATGTIIDLPVESWPGPPRLPEDFDVQSTEVLFRGVRRLPSTGIGS